MQPNEAVATAAREGTVPHPDLSGLGTEREGVHAGSPRRRLPRSPRLAPRGTVRQPRPASGCPGSRPGRGAPAHLRAADAARRLAVTDQFSEERQSWLLIPAPRWSQSPLACPSAVRRAVAAEAAAAEVVAVVAAAAVAAA